MTEDQELKKAKKALRAFAEFIILQANTVESVLENNRNLQGIESTNALDPEAWQLARHHARKILRAIETDSYLDPQWLDAIRKALSP